MANNIKFIIGAFGLQSLRTIKYEEGSQLDTKASINGLPNQPSISIPAEAWSYLGTPVFSLLEISTQDDSKSLIIDTALLEVSQSKNIVKTAINGRNGTIKEYVSDGDYQINIKGVLVNNEDGYNRPTQLIQALIALCSVPESLKVASKFLQLFDVNNIVIDEFSFPQSEGFQNVQPFELTCSSDTDIRLLLD